tara:strand:- start:257 stop:553 length:297 start_codon:yes stop_codon:yes gene_type:complete
MKNLKFEDLMDLFLRSKNNKNYEEILSIHQEFERRVEKRKLMGKKPMKTSISGFQQTRLWLNNNKDLANRDIKKVKNIKSRRSNLRNDNDINKKNTLW